MLRKEKVAPSVWVIYGKNETDVAKGFIRFQEYYENVDLKGKKGLVVRDIENWWAGYAAGEPEPYYTSWTGFNIPGKAILDLARTPNFRDGFSLAEFLHNPSRFPRWHEEETELLTLLDDMPVEEISTSYFIGMWHGSANVLEHEVAHAFFATIPTYKAEQILNIGEFPKDLYTQLAGQLVEMGYHNDVVHDEIQAYLSTYIHTLPKIFETDKYNDYTSPFVDTFQRYRKQFTPS